MNKKKEKEDLLLKTRKEVHDSFTGAAKADEKAEQARAEYRAKKEKDKIKIEDAGCVDFLSKFEINIGDRITELGWDVLGTLAMVYETEVKNRKES